MGNEPKEAASELNDGLGAAIDWEREAEKQLNIRIFVELQNEDLRKERDCYQKALKSIVDDYPFNPADYLSAWGRCRQVARLALGDA